MKDTELMDLREQVYEFLSQSVLSAIHWQQFENLLLHWKTARSLLPVRDFDMLPALSCKAVGGNTERAVTISAAWVLLLISARAFDDLQDDDPVENDWFPNSVQSALPAGIYALGAAFSSIDSEHLDLQVQSDLVSAFSRTLAIAARTQSERPSIETATMQWYFEHITAKTGMVIATGVWAGARAADCVHDGDTLENLFQFGLALGLMMQILDDLADLAERDLRRQHYTLPVILALTMKQHSLHSQLLSLLSVSPLRDQQINAILEILDAMGTIYRSKRLALIYQAQALEAIATQPDEIAQTLVRFTRVGDGT